jgi:hypothetical protein
VEAAPGGSRKEGRMKGYKIDLPYASVIAGPTSKGVYVAITRKIRRNSEEYKLLPPKPKGPQSSAVMCYRVGYKMITLLHLSNDAASAMIPLLARVLQDKIDKEKSA